MKPFESALSTQFEEFIAYRKGLGYAQHPLRSYLRMFDRYLCDQKAGPDKLQPSFFLEFRVNLKLQPSSVNRIITTARAFFNFMIRKGCCNENPLQDIPPLSENAFIPFVFSKEQIDQLLAAGCSLIRKRPKYFHKDLGVYLALLLLARCGMRISEPLGLLCAHYRRDEATVYIEKTKFKKDRLIPIPKAVVSEIENYLAVRNRLLADYHNPYLIAGIREKKLDENRVRFVFHQAVKEIGLNQPQQTIGNTTFGSPTPHSLRHSFAINTLKSVKARGISPQQALPVLAAYMGHRHYTYTAKYLKLLDADHRHGLAHFTASHKVDI